MAEEKTRIDKVREYLYEAEESVRPKTIAEAIGESSLNVGKDLHRLKEQGQAESEGDGLWKMTNEGKEALEGGGGREKGKGEKEKEISETIPSQADLFRGIGEKLGVGAKKGEVALSAIIYYVSKTANLDDLNSVWNALTEMGVDNNVKKRWIKIYAQNIPGKKIPEELREKLESGLETEKVAKTETGEILPKAKRFSIVAGEIMGDPEGDYNFNEAFKIWAQQKGVPADQVNPLAVALEAMIQTSKEGPQTLTAMLAAITPLITKQGDTSEGNIWLQFLQTQQQNSQSQMQMFQTMITTLTEDKHKAELATVNAQIEAIKTGQKAPEADQRLEALTKQIETLRESLHQEQLTRMTEQSQRTAELLQGEIKKLEQQITQVAQSQRVESSLGLLSKTIDKVDSQLSGIRGDAKPLVETIMKAGGPGPKPRSPEERAKLATIGKEAVLKERRARELEDELLSS